MTVDSITLSLIRGAVAAVREEMGTVVRRTAMSPGIREKEDYFVAVFTADGRLVHGTSLPLGANGVDCIVEKFGDSMQPGDTYLYNDPYLSHGGVSHSPDMVLAAPVFGGGQAVAIVQAWGHLHDIGGRVVGTLSPTNTEIFHEGVRYPPIHWERGGVLQQDIVDIVSRNTRFPALVSGDLRALTAAIHIGRSRLESTIERFGAATVGAAFDELIRESRTAARRGLLDRIQPGAYTAVEQLEADAPGDAIRDVAVELRREGDRLIADFSATSDQAPGSTNFLAHESCPALMFGLAATAHVEHVLLNQGLVDSIDEVVLRQGSLLRPNFPAALARRSQTLAKVQACVLGSLGAATGGQSPAVSPIFTNLNFRFFEVGSRVIRHALTEGIGVGLGARPDSDGIDSIYYIAQKNVPIEILEQDYPLRVERYELRADSGGAGFHRGGCGVVKHLRVLANDLELGASIPNRTYPARGMAGGGAGATAEIAIQPADGERWEPSVADLAAGVALHAGDVVMIATAGGGGWGDPARRPVKLIAADMAAGLLSPERARDAYGVVIDGDAVDLARTDSLRGAATR